MAKGLTHDQVRARRKANRLSALKAKEARGESKGDERAFMRIGTTNTKILTGALDVSAWTDEELKAGKRFDKNGQNRGVAPKIVPKAIHDELVKRTLAKSNELLRENLETAVENLTDIADDEDVDPKDRIKAIEIIMNRVMGKAPDKINIETETPPWQIALTAGIVSVKGTILDNGEEDEEDEE